MTTLTDTLARISHLLWTPLHIETYSLGEDAEDSGEECFENALVFDIREATEDDLMCILEDQFGDGMPDDLDFDEKVPFAMIGEVVLWEDQELEKGNFGAMAQPSYMLFADIENGTDDQVAVYMVEIDGTALPDSFCKIADDIADLKFLPGFIEG